MVTAGIAYITNSLYAANHFTQDKIWKHPYVEGTKKSRRRYWWALALNILGLVLITAAVGAFVWGVYIAAKSILELATTRELPFIDG